MKGWCHCFEDELIILWYNVICANVSDFVDYIANLRYVSDKSALCLKYVGNYQNEKYRNSI